MGSALSMRAPPAGIFTTWTHTNTRSVSRSSFYWIHDLWSTEATVLPHLVVSEEDGGADGVEEDAVRTPAELVA